MFFVKRWYNDEIISEHKTLAIARKYARGAGHTGEDLPYLTGYPPIAYVANEAGECVYNPRFSKAIGAAASSLIDSLPSDYF